MTNLSELYNTLINLEKNSEIISSLITDTNENGDIAELLVTDKAKSNIYDVFVDSFNHMLKNLLYVIISRYYYNR
jgi:hypothetical protein